MRAKKTTRTTPKDTTAMVKKNSSAIHRLKFNATERAEFVVQHEASDGVEPYEPPQIKRRVLNFRTVFFYCKKNIFITICFG